MNVLVANSLTITRGHGMELFDNLVDYKFVTKAPVNAKEGEAYVAICLESEA